MKKYFCLFLTVILFVSCTTGSVNADWASRAVVYEMNVRQYTPEGTFAAAQEHLPRLKELGVDILWLMPIHPIGEKNRKGTMGSYYAPKDYCDVNPEFGTMEDFDNFLAAAHDCGLKVILDMVCNHTSPDGVWNTPENYDWYFRDENGNTIVEYDWDDIAKLDYGKEEVRQAMADVLHFWVNKGVDGYRCDAAWSLPTDFWAGILPKMKAENPQLYFLAEAEKPELNEEGGFDAAYAWKLHHTLNDIAQGKAGIPELTACLDTMAVDFPEAYMLSFTSNHDENSWAGTEFERMGDAAKVMAVLTYTLPACQPLIYTGQEVGWNKRFEFFEKDVTPDWTANEYTDFYKELNKLYHENPALAAGTKGGAFEILSTEDNTLVFSRTLPGNKVTVSAQLVAPWAYSISVE